MSAKKRAKKASRPVLKTRPRQPARRVKNHKDTTRELKLSNEQAISVNEKLRCINEELENSNYDLKNLFSSSGVAALCLDRQLHIKWFSPGMRPLCKLRSGDIGRPVGDFAAILCGDGLIRDVRAVLKQHQPLTNEIKLPNNNWYLRRILPYLKEGESISGVTISFVDITESKRSAEALLATQQQLAESLEQRVRERTNQLRDLSVELSLAEERERRALARDLHDDLGQLLAVAKIKIAALAKHETVATQQHRVDEVKQILDKAHSAVQSLTFQLSPPVLYELGLIPALEWLSEEMQRLYGLEVIMNDDGKPKPLEIFVRIILFRAVRELLINVAKHANVTRARVDTKRMDGKLQIKVSDEGIGFHPHRTSLGNIKSKNKGNNGGFGLLNVRERLSYIGGGIQTESVPGDGTIITLTAPISPRTRDQEIQK